MAYEEQRNSNGHGDPGAAPLITAAIAGALVVVAVVIALVALYNRTKRDLIRERVYNAPSIAVEQLHAEQEARLNVPRWIDKKEGVVAIPIDDAIRLVSRELALSADGTGPWSPRPAETSRTARPADNAESRPSGADTKEPPVPVQRAESPSGP